MRSLCIVLAALAAVVLITAASAARGGGGDPPGSPTNPLPALPNPTPPRIPPPTSPPTNQAPRQPDGTQLGAPTSTSTRTQRGSTALHDGKPMVAQPEAPRQQKEQAPSTARPCSLVTKAQAREIIGAPVVEPLEAPQGPTCIYQTGARGTYVTLAAQNASIERLQQQISKPRIVTVAGRRGVCGTAGGPVLYVPLADRRTLVVMAACDMAMRFATQALARL